MLKKEDGSVATSYPAIDRRKHSFTSALSDAEIEDFKFHDLRHTFGTLAVDRGAPLTGVRDAMGQASLETYKSPGPWH